MSNPLAAKFAAKAAEYARANPTPTNLATANGICIDAIRAGATATDIRHAVQNNRS